MEPNSHTLVLVVEDEPLIRMITVESFADAGFETLEAETADEALSLLEARGDIDVMFTDVNMPGSCDGVTLSLLASKRWPNLRIVLTSGKAQVSQKDMPPDSRFVSKPYHPDHVAWQISQMI